MTKKVIEHNVSMDTPDEVMDAIQDISMSILKEATRRGLINTEQGMEIMVKAAMMHHGAERAVNGCHCGQPDCPGTISIYRWTSPDGDIVDAKFDFTKSTQADQQRGADHVKTTH